MRAEREIRAFLKDISHELHGMRSGLKSGVRRLTEGRESDAPEVIICDEALIKLEAVVNRIDQEIKESENL